MFHK